MEFYNKLELGFVKVPSFIANYIGLATYKIQPIFLFSEKNQLI
jgi:hypothetical protein